MGASSDDVEAPAASIPAADGIAVPEVGAFGRWYTVVVLTLLYTLAFSDRQVISLLAIPIKRDLGLTDVQLSFLIGLAFVILFSILGIPAGWLVDRVSRKRMVGLGVAFWSMMAIVSGLARSYGQLFIGRVGVGVGESTIVPASFAMIQTTLAPSQRGRAFGIFSLGPTFGNSISLLLGGAIFAAATAGHFSGLPIIGALKPWQTVFFLMGALGLPLALLALTLREPVRPSVVSLGEDEQSSFGDAIRHVRMHQNLYVRLIGFITLTAMFAFSFGAWVPSMLARNFSMAPAEVGYRIGAIILISSLAGQLAFGAAIDRFTAAGRPDAAPWVGLFTVTATLVLSVAIPLATSLDLTSILLVLYYFVQGIFYPIGANCLARITPRHLMGKLTAIYLIFQGGIAAALGPTLVAVAGEYAFSGPRAIGYGIALVAVCLLPVALLLLMSLRARMAHLLR